MALVGDASRAAARTEVACRRPDLPRKGQDEERARAFPPSPGPRVELGSLKVQRAGLIVGLAGFIGQALADRRVGLLVPSDRALVEADQSLPTSGVIWPWPWTLSNDFTVPNNFM